MNNKMNKSHHSVHVHSTHKDEYEYHSEIDDHRCSLIETKSRDDVSRLKQKDMWSPQSYYRINHRNFSQTLHFGEFVVHF